MAIEDHFIQGHYFEFSGKSTRDCIILYNNLDLIWTQRKSEEQRINNAGQRLNIWFLESIGTVWQVGNC